MRTLPAAALAAVFMGSPALGADNDFRLSPGKPAGVKAAQLDVTDKAIIATTAVILVTAVVLGATQKGYTSNATTASTSP
jgi:hypothetical protein